MKGPAKSKPVLEKARLGLTLEGGSCPICWDSTLAATFLHTIQLLHMVRTSLLAPRMWAMEPAKDKSKEGHSGREICGENRLKGWLRYPC